MFLSSLIQAARWQHSRHNNHGNTACSATVYAKVLQSLRLEHLTRTPYRDVGEGRNVFLSSLIQAARWQHSRHNNHGNTACSATVYAKVLQSLRLEHLTRTPHRDVGEGRNVFLSSLIQAARWQHSRHNNHGNTACSATVYAKVLQSLRLEHLTRTPHRDVGEGRNVFLSSLIQAARRQHARHNNHGNTACSATVCLAKLLPLFRLEHLTRSPKMLLPSAFKALLPREQEYSTLPIKELSPRKSIAVHMLLAKSFLVQRAFLCTRN